MAQQMAERGAKEVYIFFNNTVGGCAVRNALELQAKIAKSCLYRLALLGKDQAKLGGAGLCTTFIVLLSLNAL